MRFLQMLLVLGSLLAHLPLPEAFATNAEAVPSSFVARTTETKGRDQAGAQTEELAGSQDALLARASEGARTAWQRLVRAGGGTGEPITAFHIKAEVRVRGEIRSNDFEVEYRYLGPHFIRFAVPGTKGTAKREIGRGPGERQQAYWMVDPERNETIVLQGRDYTEDRKLVDEMLVVARNFIAFSDLSRLKLDSLALSSGPPADLPNAWALKSWRKKLTWLHVESADFALLHPDRRQSRERRPYAVELGLDPGHGLPRLAIIREKPAIEGVREALAPPMLFHLDEYKLRDGFLVPSRVQLHQLVLQAGQRRFADKPAQEIDLLEARLRPAFTPEMFQPQ